METNKLLAKAINLAMQAHAGQTDKAGMPYMGHVMRVMQAGRTIDEKIAGVLHDIVEDTPWTFWRRIPRTHRRCPALRHQTTRRRTIRGIH